jgi:hypothetical protein
MASLYIVGVEYTWTAEQHIDVVIDVYFKLIFIQFHIYIYVTLQRNNQV